MTMLKKYVVHMNKGNADKIAELFTEDCNFDDGARPIGYDDIRAECRENVRTVFNSVFKFLFRT